MEYTIQVQVHYTIEFYRNSEEELSSFEKISFYLDSRSFVSYFLFISSASTFAAFIFFLHIWILWIRSRRLAMRFVHSSFCCFFSSFSSCLPQTLYCSMPFSQFNFSFYFLFLFVIRPASAYSWWNSYYKYICILWLWVFPSICIQIVCVWAKNHIFLFCRFGMNWIYILIEWTRPVCFFVRMRLFFCFWIECG